MGNACSALKRRIGRRSRRRQRGGNNSHPVYCNGLLVEVSEKSLLEDASRLSRKKRPRQTGNQRFWKSPFEKKAHIQPTVYSINIDRDLGIGEITSLCHYFRTEDSDENSESDDPGETQSAEEIQRRVTDLTSKGRSPSPGETDGGEKSQHSVESETTTTVGIPVREATYVDQDGAQEKDGQEHKDDRGQKLERYEETEKDGREETLEVGQIRGLALKDNVKDGTGTQCVLGTISGAIESPAPERITGNSCSEEEGNTEEKISDISSDRSVSPVSSSGSPTSSANTTSPYSLQIEEPEVKHFPDFVTPFLNKDVRIRLQFHRAIHSNFNSTFKRCEPVHLWRHVKYIDARFLCHPLQNRIKIMLEESHGCRRKPFGISRRSRPLFPRAIIVNTSRQTPGLYVAGKEFSILLGPPLGGAHPVEGGHVLHAVGTYIRYLDTDQNYLMLWRASIIGTIDHPLIE